MSARDDFGGRQRRPFDSDDIPWDQIGQGLRLALTLGSDRPGIATGSDRTCSRRRTANWLVGFLSRRGERRRRGTQVWQEVGHGSAGPSRENALADRYGLPCPCPAHPVPGVWL